MKELWLTKTPHPVIVDDEDYLRCSQYGWLIGDTSSGYFIKTTKHPQINLSNFIMGTNLMYDHKDRNPFNNQRENLRLANPSQNMINRVKIAPSECSSPYKGVYFNKQNKRWHSRISVDKKRIHLGFYPTEARAASRYNAAAVQYHKEFAVLNIFE